MPANLYNLPAPAKLNLFLHVTGRRDDGRHLLESVFVMIDRADSIDLEELPDGRVERYGRIIGETENDLCVRAARLLQEHCSTNRGVRITVRKNIPAGAGMGGGSSDAATTLIGLNHLWGLGLGRKELLTLGLRLGADVPFFIKGRNCWVEGIGEILEPIEIEPMKFAVLWPGRSVSTAEIFGSPSLTRDTKSVRIAFFVRKGFSGNTALFGWNDLQPVAVELEPRIQQALEMLAPCHSVRMTGSGSAVFGVLPTDVQMHFRSLPEDWLGFEAKTLGSHPLADWLDD